MNKKLAYLFGCQVGESPQYWCLFFQQMTESPSTGITLAAFDTVLKWEMGKICYSDMLEIIFRQPPIWTGGSIIIQKSRVNKIFTSLLCPSLLSLVPNEGSSLVTFSRCRYNNRFNFHGIIFAQLSVWLRSTSVPSLMFHILRQCPTFWLARVESLKTRTESVNV